MHACGHGVFLETKMLTTNKDMMSTTEAGRYGMVYMHANIKKMELS